jgi:hypothetical protein
MKGGRRMRGGECGIDALRAASERFLREKALLIAEMLGQRAVAGDETCMKLLCDLAEEHKELSQAKKKGAKRSLATEWANEPEWTEEDERAAQAAEGRE